MILRLVETGLAGAVINLTVTRSSFFERFRDWMDARGPAFFAKLFRCPYCFGHWVGLGLALLIQVRLFSLSPVLDWFLSGLVLTYLVIVFSGLLYQATKVIVVTH